MEKPFRKDISELKEFSKYGDTFKQIRNNPDTGWWLYERETHYEVVKGMKYTNPDGSVVYVYPSEKDWGTYGYTIPKCWWAKPTINFIMKRNTISAQEMYEFKKILKYTPGYIGIAKIREF